MMSVFFQSGPVQNYETALESDKGAFNMFFSNMMERGVYLAPSAFEAWFISVAHSEDDLQFTLKAATESL